MLSDKFPGHRNISRHPEPGDLVIGGSIPPVISIVIDNPEPVPEDPDLIFGITVPVTRNSNITRLTKVYGNILSGSLSPTLNRFPSYGNNQLHYYLRGSPGKHRYLLLTRPI